jgi:hypothetical protein
MLDLDALTDEEHVQNAQWAKAARKRMQEAAEIKKSFKGLQEAIKKDPFSALRDPAFGNLDIRKQVEDQLVREYQESQMDEPSRKAAALQRELEQERAKREEYESTAKARSQQQLEAQVFAETRKEFISALEATDLPKTKETLYLMAQVAQTALDNGIELSPQQIAGKVKERITGMHRSITGSLKGEALIKHLGDDVVKEVIRHSVAKAKGAKANPVAPPVKQNVEEGEDRPKRKMPDYNKIRKGWFRE